jgi:hypothetical protein
MSRIFYGCPSPDALPPIDISDVIDLKPPYAPREGWIELTKQADTTNGIALHPTVEAGVVNALQQECGQTAAEHGFSRDWEDAAFLEKLAEKMSGYQMWEITGDVDGKDTGSVEDYLVEMAGRYRNNVLGTKLMLIVSELSEGLESLRHNGGAEGALDGQGNFGEELADAIVRILDTGTFVKANLGDELLSKMAVNKDRPHMHGNKSM